MSNSNDQIKFSFKATLAAAISMFFVYWMYQLYSGMKDIENNLMDQPYLIRMAIKQLFPQETQIVVTGFNKLLLFSKVFFITFLVKAIISVIQAIKSNLSDSQTYIIILFIIEGLFLYFTFHIKMDDILAILFIPNIIIYGLLDD